MVATMDGSVSDEATPLSEAEVLADRAEEVRAWLVQVRGGASFLSSTDTALLARWLHGGVQVTRILGAIEAAARHRRAKRLRGRFTLGSSERFLGQAGGTVTFVSEVEPAVDVPERLATLRQASAVRLAALPGETEEAARARCRVVREFHAAAWEALGPGRAPLLERAAEELADLKELLEAEDFLRVVEEAARHRVRVWFPELSIEAVCAGVTDGVE